MSRFPKVPKGEDKRFLYFADMSVEEQEQARSAGWSLVDVRLLPNATPNQKREAVMAWLEGIRVGTIEVPASRLKFLELEAKCLGMISTAKNRRDEDEDDWDSAINGMFADQGP